MPTLDYQSFIHNQHRSRKQRFNYVSLFSGAGIGEYGLKLAGGHCIASCEIDAHRRNVHKENIKSEQLFDNVVVDKTKIIEHINSYNIELDLLIASPPCQGFSTANAKRGMREDPDHANKDSRNALFFDALDIAVAIQPKIILFENVPNFPNRVVHNRVGSKTDTIMNFMSVILHNYEGKHFDICFSKYGVPQRRKRSIIVFIKNDKPNLLPFLQKIEQHFDFRIKNQPLNLNEVMKELEPLDAKSKETSISQLDTLHQVPVNDEIRYKWISDIPPYSGRTAWENACVYCNDNSTPMFEVICKNCDKPMLNRPHVKDGSIIRPIKGFKTSYKRMNPYEVAPTVTTNSNSFSSDMKIHPYENRVLSVREVALLQTIPYSFKWTEEQFFKSKHLLREMIGEAIPPLFTYQLGYTISTLICTNLDLI